MRTTITNRMMIGTSLIGITFSLGLGNAYATDQLCAVVPTCEELGYTDTSCPEGSDPIKCPLDLTKLHCGSSNTSTASCEEMGYTETDCGLFTLLKCPFDNSKMFCGSNCKSGYVKGSVNTNACIAARQVIYSGSTPIGVAISSHVAVSMDDASSSMQWAAAKSYCAGLTTGGKSWRLPTKDEEEAAAAASIQDNINGTLVAYGGRIWNMRSWSSDEYKNDASLAWGPCDYSGTGYCFKTYPGTVRCVFAF